MDKKFIEVKDPSVNVIAVSGSMKYWDLIQETCARLTKIGYVVLSPYKIQIELGDDIEKIKQMLKIGFERKIDMADILFVINKDGYIGESVQSEIDYAFRNKKRIEFLEVRDIAPIFTICGSAKFKDHIMQYADNLRAKGKIVFTPESFNINNPEKLSKEKWDRWYHIHYQKMQMADFVLIYDEEGYIGDDTLREIKYALLRNMRVIYYSELQKFDDVDKL